MVNKLEGPRVEGRGRKRSNPVVQVNDHGNLHQCRDGGEREKFSESRYTSTSDVERLGPAD